MSFDYSKIKPITRGIRAARQLAKRHYGLHPYFTRRPSNVVRSYILRYSRAGDRVLDPFGGSGVTSVEAFLANRHGIHNDLNPLGNFIAQQIADTTYADTDYIKRAFSCVDAACGDLVRGIPRMTDQEVERRLKAAKLPENVELPKNADVPRFYDLFTPRQLLALALLRETIDCLPDRAGKSQLLLAWSATITKLNRTFLSAKGRAESRGGSSVFSIYRYKVAKSPIELPPWEAFAERVANVIRAKTEVLKEVRYLELKDGFHGTFESHGNDALELPKLLEPVDYIFTDPPYGGHIAYLDLSTMWNHWLGFSISEPLREKEIIVGGELDKSEEDYLERLRLGIKACVEMLKNNRWLSIVFQHWNIAYFEAILEAAEQCGAGLRCAVTQVGDTIWSMHKKKNLERVLAGEMILTFFKDGRVPERKGKENHLEIEQLVDAVLPAVAGPKGHLHGELLFNSLIAEAWRQHALHTLRISREDFLHLLERRGWHYDPERHRWTRRLAETHKQWRLW